MSLYYLLAIKYGNKWEQVKCFIVFLLLCFPAALMLVLVQSISETAFQLLLFIQGWMIWTFVEYVLHRFWMHDKKHAKAPIVKTHNYHHSHPGEITVTTFKRIIMMMITVGVIVVAFYLNNYFTLLAGIITGVVGYFLMHKMLHLPLSKLLFKRLLRYHIYHHCKYPNTCFGISVPWWDDLFGTVPHKPIITERIIQFYFRDSHH